MVAGLALALVAWREASKAKATEAILVKDYASFVADKFIQMSADAYMSKLGFLSYATPDGDRNPISLLRREAESGGLTARTDLRDWGPAIEYAFQFDRANSEVTISGPSPDTEEMEQLKTVLHGFSPSCGARQLKAFSTLAADSDVPMGGLVETNIHGDVAHIYGFRFDRKKAVEEFFIPVITSNQCRCNSKLLAILPPRFTSTSDARQAASFTIRDNHGAVLYQSQPQYPDAGSVLERFTPELPFAGWTVQVAINPEVVRPLLPYGGRDSSLIVMSLILAFLLSAGLFGIRSLRHDRQLVRMQQEFVANVSHELRTPLSRIRLFNELALDRNGEESKWKHYREVIDRECRRLTLTIENLLDFSRSTRAVRKFESEVIDVNEVLNSALQAFRAASNPSTFHLRTDLQDCGQIIGDSSALQQALINLLDNAVKYSAAGAEVLVKAESDDRFVRLSVRDHGCGIPAGEIDKIFDEFYRVHNDEFRPAGSGLGLTLVHQTIEAHGGRISVWSEVGTGSTFTIELPLRTSKAAEVVAV